MMKRQAGLSLVFCMALLLLCACSTEKGEDRPRVWSTLTPAFSMEDGVSYHTERSERTERAIAEQGYLPCGVSYTLYKDGELMLQNGRLTDYLSEVPVIQKNLERISRISFDAGVTEIGANTCKGMEKLQKVSFGQELAIIGSQAFIDCRTLVEIHFSSALQYVGDGAFAGCTSIRSIELPEDTCAIIEKNAFSGCSGLMELCLPENGAISFGERAFSNCTSLGIVRLTKAVTGIGNNCFQDCTGLSTAEIGENVQNMGQWLFTNCTSLRKVIFACSAISSEALINCTSLTSIDVRPGVLTIGERAFSGCENLSQVVLPDGLLDIGKNAFADCRSMESIIIPDSVTHIGYGFLDGCESCTRGVLFRGSKKQWASIQTENSKGVSKNQHLYTLQNKQPQYNFTYGQLRFYVTTDYQN